MSQILQEKYNALYFRYGDLCDVYNELMGMALDAARNNRVLSVQQITKLPKYERRELMSTKLRTLYFIKLEESKFLSKFRLERADGLVSCSALGSTFNIRGIEQFIEDGYRVVIVPKANGTRLYSEVPQNSQFLYRPGLW